MAKAKRYTAEQLRDAEKMAATLANVPEEKRTLVIMMTNGSLRFIQSLPVAFYGRWQSHDLGELVQQFLAAVSDHHVLAPVILH